MNDNETMSMSEYARHRGITKQAVSKLVKEDRLLLTEEGKINVGISDALMDASPRTIKPGESDPQKGVVKGKRKRRATKKRIKPLSDREKKDLKTVLDYPEARAKLTKYKAELAKLALEEEKGKLVRASKVKKEAFECARRTRNKVLSVVDRVSGIIAAESDEIKIKEILDKELREVLEELSTSVITTNEKGDMDAESGKTNKGAEPPTINLGSGKTHGKGTVRTDNGKALKKRMDKGKTKAEAKAKINNTIQKNK